MMWDESGIHKPEDFDVSDTDQIWGLIANGAVCADVEADWDSNFSGQKARIFAEDRSGLRSMNIERALLNIHQRLLVLEGKLPEMTKVDK